MELNHLWQVRSGGEYLDELKVEILPEENRGLFRRALELTPAKQFKQLFLDAFDSHREDGLFPDQGDLEMRFDTGFYTTAVEATLGSKHHRYLLKKQHESNGAESPVREVNDSIAVALLRLSENSTKAVKMGQLFNEINPGLLNGNQQVSAGFFHAEIESLSEIGHVLVDRSKTDGSTVAFTTEGLEFAKREQAE
jgi:hypothetical protein